MVSSSKTKISIVSGGFDPIHSGHIAYIKSAKEKGDKLVVCLNSDQWLINKKGKYFLPFYERKTILENLSCVDYVIGFDDDDQGSCTNGILEVKNMFPDEHLIFCNGGDRNQTNIPEMAIDGVEFLFSIGGDTKLNSSSLILKEWNYPRTDRVWGFFHDLFITQNLKLKELTVSPGKGMSFQKHNFRNEIWFVFEGKCKVKYSKNDPNLFEDITLNKLDTFFVDKGDWHQIFNPFNDECKIIEIQYGQKTIEDDIERLYFYENNEK